LAGVGLGAFLFPACINDNRLEEPYSRGGPGYVLMNRQAGNPAYARTLADNSALARAGDPRRSPIIPEPASKADAAASDPPYPPVEVPTTQPVKHEESSAVELPPAVEAPVTGEPRRPALPDEPVRAPDWPKIGGVSVVTDPPAVKPPDSLPKIEPGPIAAPPNTPPKGIVAPETDVPPPGGTSLKVPDSAPPTVVPSAPSFVVPPSSPDESIVVRAIKAFQANRPQDAAELLKQLDPANQDVLMYLTPLIARLGEGSVNAMPPEELAIQIDRLQNAATMLKAKASLRADHVCFCRGVRKFADVDPYDAHHEFRPGDMVFLYAELKNFTCEPVVAQPRQPVQRGFTIRLAATLELRDSQNNLIWRTDLTKTDFAQTPPQDYYHTYRFCVPERLPSGTYTLWLNVIDKPTGRAIRKPVEMRVGQS
jgi:hypothetical protein